MDKIQQFILGLYPTTKFVFSLFIIVSVLIVPGYIYAYMTLLLVLAVTYLAGKSKLFINLVFKGLLPIIILIFLLQSFFYPGETILWSGGIFSVTEEGVQFSLFLTSRIISIGAAFICFFQITPAKEFVYSLEKLGFSPKATYVVLSTLYIIPEMRKLSHTIMDAQKSRGVEMEGNLMIRIKAFLPTLSPLILSSIASTEERAITLESRAFTVKGKKTSLYQLHKTKADTIIRIIFLVLTLGIIGWRLMI